MTLSELCEEGTPPFTLMIFFIQEASEQEKFHFALTHKLLCRKKKSEEGEMASGSRNGGKKKGFLGRKKDWISSLTTTTTGPASKLQKKTKIFFASFARFSLTESRSQKQKKERENRINGFEEMSASRYFFFSSDQLRQVSDLPLKGGGGMPSSSSSSCRVSSSCRSLHSP